MKCSRRLGKLFFERKLCDETSAREEHEIVQNQIQDPVDDTLALIAPDLHLYSVALDTFQRCIWKIDRKIGPTDSADAVDFLDFFDFNDESGHFLTTLPRGIVNYDTEFFFGGGGGD